jgi:hypothetical protein
LPNYFDLTSRACLSCPENSIFNNSIGGCSKCPGDKPISSGSVCIPCLENTYFNATAGVCQHCSGGLKINVFVQQHSFIMELIAYNAIYQNISIYQI